MTIWMPPLPAALALDAGSAFWSGYSALDAAAGCADAGLPLAEAGLLSADVVAGGALRCAGKG